MPAGVVPTWERLSQLRGSSGRRLQGEARRLLRKEIPQARATYLQEKRRRLEHDAMIDTCASIFMPGSPMERATGYTFLSVEPLLEKGAKSFDLWIHNLATRSAVFVECKSSIAVPRKEIGSVCQAVRVVADNEKYLGEVVGERIDHIEYVLCVNATQDQRVAEALAEMERSKEIADDFPRVLIWRMNQFKGQSIQFFRLVPGRTNAIENRHRDNGLMRSLRDPVEASGTQLATKVYPSSHITRKSLGVVGAILQESLRLGRTLDELPLAEVRSFFGSRANLGHYAAPKLEPGITQTFIRDGIQAKVLSQADESGAALRVLSGGQRLQTRLSHYEKALDEWLALRLARERTLEALRERAMRSRSTLYGYESPTESSGLSR